MKRGTRGPAFADAQRLARCDASQWRIDALDAPAIQEALVAVRGDPLEVHQHATRIQRHQQVVTTLAQTVGANALGDQVKVTRISTASVTPPALRKARRFELAPLPFGLPLAPGLLDALAHLLGFAGVHRLTATPGAGAARLPAPERTRGDAIGKQAVPAV
ncbi:hypothetical protein D3C77_469550 [compost metagenome]